jgi:hypothetical protein
MSFEIRNLSIEEVRKKIEAEDLQMMMTFGVTMSGRMDDLIGLKEFLISDPRFNVIWKSISTSHLRVVKLEQWNEFQKWKDSTK